MNNTRNPIPNSRLFKLPFIEGTLKLTFETLNSYSLFRFTKGLTRIVRKISYQNEWLTIGIKINDEKEEKVYLKVTKKELLVSCSVDTDENYLSQYAYLVLDKLMHINDYCDFERYYWPDFFTSKNGGSKYLSIINDRNGLDITFKPAYAFFFKPGQELRIPMIEKKINRPQMIFMDKAFVVKQQLNGIGFCFADTFQKSWHSNHNPFLIPYSGILTQNNNAIKTFTSFVTSESNEAFQNFSPMQIELYKVCRKMELLAPILKPNYNCTKEQIASIDKLNYQRSKDLFTLWQDAFPYLIHQPFTHHYFTYGLRNIRQKPRKMDMKSCTFSYEIPKIIFLWKDKGEYYELDFRFKIDKQLFKPSEKNTAFFINEENNPTKFYLFESFSHCQLTLFFVERRFRILILKAHYGDFKDYLESLRAIYEVRDL
ncbi:hypothetical protein ACFOWA_19335 [Pedobacter lithocola]|uniref:Uncharacterized protein n=1 Tax=Pedobacter lithocola TaxID=1908239 RepID=A0ABV8PDE6_9SPHI